MNKLLVLCGLVFLGNTATPNAEQTYAQVNSPNKELKCPVQARPVKLIKASTDVQDYEFTYHKEWGLECKKNMSTSTLDLNRIVFLESEEHIDLGFNTADYLPENFDPYEVYVDLDQIAYIQSDEDGLSGFNVAAYLPKDFNAYAFPADIRAISYIEEEPVLDLDTAPYLPEGFDPYEYYFDIHSVEYIEEEEEVILEFSTQDYLPRGFDPYSR
ncbi:MAG: hypothetical protein KJN76_00495 [Eudoraea sp.]|nr:hypothetical protein [Eudoraea sp.]